MTSQTDDIAVERSRHAMTLGVLLLAAAHGVLRHAYGLIPQTDPRTLARMESREIPYDLPASLERDLDHAIGHKLEEAISEIESALSDTPEILHDNWRGCC